MHDTIKVLLKAVEQSNPKLKKSDRKVTKSIIDALFFQDDQTNLFDGIVNEIFKDYLSEYSRITRKTLYEVNFDIGNMLSIARCFEENLHSFTNNPFVSNILLQLASIITKTFSDFEIKSVGIRDGFDEFKYYIEPKPQQDVGEILYKIQKKVQEFSESYKLDSIKHTKPNKPCGLTLKISYSQLGSRQELEVKNESEVKRHPKDSINPEEYTIPESIIDILNNNIPNKHQIFSFIKEDIAHAYVMTNTINPSKLRKFAFENTMKGNQNANLMLSIYDCLEQDSPFELIHSHIRYQWDLNTFLILLKKDILKNLHVYDISWLNWGGIINTLGMKSAVDLKSWIQKNLVTGAYLHNEEIYENCFFYDDYGSLKLILVNNQDSVNEVLKIITSKVEQYINQVPIKYVIQGKKKDQKFGAIKDPRDSNNKGIKIKIEELFNLSDGKIKSYDDLIKYKRKTVYSNTEILSWR